MEWLPAKVMLKLWTENGRVRHLTQPEENRITMRYLIAVLALAGIIVSVLAFRIHYSNDVEPCDINAHWDCGIVNHSRYSMVGHIPVAAIGIVGYFALAVLALTRRRSLTLLASVLGLAYALYLTNIEAHKLEVWCLYCVTSQLLIALITLLAGLWAFFGRPKKPA
jgi:vitamin-K-epoxide reductase (warfarin-sensitive)